MGYKWKIAFSPKWLASHRVCKMLFSFHSLVMRFITTLNQPSQICEEDKTKVSVHCQQKSKTKKETTVKARIEIQRKLRGLSWFTLSGILWQPFGWKAAFLAEHNYSELYFFVKCPIGIFCSLVVSSYLKLGELTLNTEIMSSLLLILCSITFLSFSSYLG